MKLADCWRMAPAAVGGALYWRLAGGTDQALLCGVVFSLLLQQMNRIFAPTLPLLRRGMAAAAVLTGAQVLAELTARQWLALPWMLPDAAATFAGSLALALGLLPLDSWLGYWLLHEARPEYGFL